MSNTAAFPSDVAFTRTVKALQARKGSRAGYAGMEANGSWQTAITPDLADFIAAQTSVMLATANADGQPYVQHRGGPAGFLRILDDHTIGFVDYAGNRQYITAGNLEENPKAYIFMIDYTRRLRIKLWGTARVVEGDVALLRELMPANYRARPEQAILFTLSAWDANCPQHIPQRFDAADVAATLAERDSRIAILEAENRRLKGSLREWSPPTKMPSRTILATPWFYSLGVFVRNRWNMFRSMSRDRRILSRLDDHVLRDIGISRSVDGRHGPGHRE